MSRAPENARAARLADPDIGEAICTSDGGTPVPVPVATGRADAVAGSGDARLWSETTRAVLRLVGVAQPRHGDRGETGGGTFRRQGEPVRDRGLRVWTVDPRPG